METDLQKSVISERTFSHIIPADIRRRLVTGEALTPAELRSLPKGVPYSLHYAGIERFPLIDLIPGTRTPLYRLCDLNLLFFNKDAYKGTAAFIGQRALTNSRINIPFSRAYRPALFSTIETALRDKFRYDREKGEIHALTPQQAIYKAWVKFFRLRFLKMSRVEFSELIISVEGRTHGSDKKIKTPSKFSPVATWEETTEHKMVTLPSWDTFHEYLWPLWVYNLQLGWPTNKRVSLKANGFIPKKVPFNVDAQFLKGKKRSK